MQQFPLFLHFSGAINLRTRLFLQMLSMLEEFYHEDHGEQHMRIVFLHPSEPDASKKAVLSDIRFAQKVCCGRMSCCSVAEFSWLTNNFPLSLTRLPFDYRFNTSAELLCRLRTCSA